MQALTPEGRRIVEAVAERHGVSTDAVTVLLQALVAGGGTAAQFNHPDLGGMGQWSQGGMIMVGDMFNHGLKARVDALCNELAGLVRGQTVLAPAGSRQSQSQSHWHGVPNVQTQGFGGAAGGPAGVSLFVPGTDGDAWWPAALGSPASTGAQNDLRYAWFSGARRLAIRRNGHVTVYDTGDHRLSGFSQQQSGDQSLTFTSQHGVVRVADLPEVGVAVEAPTAPRPSPIVRGAPDPAVPPAAGQPSRAPTPSSDDVFGKIEKLAELRQKGILTDEEFAAKKTELLSRL